MLTYKAIIFDLGGVVINVSMDKIFDHWAKTTGFEKIYVKQIFVANEVFHQFEKGEFSPLDYKEYVSDKLGLEISEREFYKVWNDVFNDLDPRIDQLLRVLKSKLRLVVLTNTNEIHANKWKIMYKSIIEYFEEIFCSYEIHVRKPKRKAYEIVLEYLQLESKFVLFLDDKLENVNGASDIGIRSILVNSTEQMIAELTELGIDE